MTDNGNLIQDQKAKAKAYMATNDPDGRLTYHSWRHVSNVITALEDMLPDFDFDPVHQEDLLLAAIWHDADYAKGKEGHKAWKIPL